MIETLVEAVPPRPCDAAGLLDEMSGSTRGPRDPGGAVEGVAGPQEREAGEGAHRGGDAAPARLVADAVRAGASDLLGDPGFSIRVPTTEHIRSRTGTTEWLREQRRADGGSAFPNVVGYAVGCSLSVSP